MSVKFLFVMSVLFASFFMITACESSLSDIESDELRKRAYRCATGTDLTTTEIQICSNIQRECKRRQAAGHFDC